MNKREDATAQCCAECGKGGVVSLKACKACMSVRYCNADCQRNHWPTHKKECKQRAAELHDEALFKDPPTKEDCPICFIPMPQKLICCVSLPPATTSSVPIDDFVIANEELADQETEAYYPCCGKNICIGCVHSFAQSGNIGKCPFCNSDRSSKTEQEDVQVLMKRVEANDAASIYMMANDYYQGINGLQQDQTKAMELYARAANLGYSKAHSHLGVYYYEGRDLKKAKFHWEAAAMAGHEVARCNLGFMEAESRNMERAFKHWMIAASAGESYAMHQLRTFFEQGAISRKTIDSTLKAYNNSCAEMRSEARDAYMRRFY
jgi:TPR repeat protein